MAFPDPTQRSIQELIALDDRVAVVTGAAKGIGQAIAQRLVEAGARVLLVDLDDSVRATAAALGPGVRAIVGDVRQPDFLKLVAESAEAGNGQLMIWVNNAGAYPVKPALETTTNEWNELIALDLSAAFFGSCAAARNGDSRTGRRDHQSVFCSWLPCCEESSASYVTCKFGLRGLTAALASEWSGHNIRLLAIAPGLVDTASMRNAASRTPMFEQYAERTPSGRAALPDEIAKTVLFAVSDLASFHTGSTIPADGGEVASGGSL